MNERFAKGSLALLSVIWMTAAGWVLFGQGTDPEAEALRQQRFERMLNDCRGQFSERYECTSTLLRKKSSDLANWWAGRLLLIFGPPLAAGATYAVFANLRERRREAIRNRARLKRREQEAEAARSADEEDLPLREIDEIRRRADERRRAAKQRNEPQEQAAGRSAGHDSPEPREPPTD